MSTHQAIPHLCWTRSAAHPGLWIYQYTGGPADIEWLDDGSYRIGATGNWQFATGAQPPAPWFEVPCEQLEQAADDPGE
jgi:hypothetical protein